MNIKLQIYTKSVCDPMKEVTRGLLSSRADANKIEHSRLFTKMHSLYRRSKLLAKFGYYPWHKHFMKLNSNKISNREGKHSTRFGTLEKITFQVESEKVCKTIVGEVDLTVMIFRCRLGIFSSYANWFWLRPFLVVGTMGFVSCNFFKVVILKR